MLTGLLKWWLNVAIDWTSPQVNTLSSVDSFALQQIFKSISQEFARLNREIADLKLKVNTGEDKPRTQLG